MVENAKNRFRLPPSKGPVEALGQSDVFLNFQQSLARVAPVERPILLIGERGTGKELAAARIHFLSQRWDQPFIKLNCAALSTSILESELFGHEAGAFTGAARRRAGRFEAAEGGTLFLDEIGQMSMAVQEKLLGVIEYGTFERVGSSESIHVDVRIVGATNVDLPALARAGKFKPDLLDRLAFEVLHVPPLRMRSTDIFLLAQHFANGMASELGRAQAPALSGESRRALEAHSWPGNIRELRNVIERAVCRNDDPLVCEFDPFRAPFPVMLENAGSDSQPDGLLPEIATQLESKPVDFAGAIAELEFSLLMDALEKARFQQRRAASILGLSYHQFRGLYRKFQSKLPGQRKAGE